MSKTNKVIYWVATLWLSLGMLSTGSVQLFHLTPKVDFISHLGYPGYSMRILAIWKILGVVALLIPKFPLLKEWAYAGFFFAMTGAVFSHIAFGDPASESFPALFLLILTLVSWFFRPADRRVLSFTKSSMA